MNLLPKYTIRYSKRAKYVRLSISINKGLEVILPFKSSADCVPALLKDKQRWINKHADKLTPIIKPNLPETVHLQAMGLLYQVNYLPNNNINLKVTVNNNAINITGKVTDENKVKRALIKTIKNISKEHFNLKAQKLAKQFYFSYTQIKIRAQKTRWGSCSANGNINLNYKLIYMPPSFLNYVILHEFAHTKQMNHSKLFWQTLESVLPNSKWHDAQMKHAHKYIPNWSEYEFA